MFLIASRIYYPRWYVFSIWSNLKLSPPDFWSLTGKSVVAENCTVGYYIFEKKTKCFSFVFVLHLFNILYYKYSSEKFFLTASGIMLMLICLKYLFWAATGRVSAVSISVLCHPWYWKGGSEFWNGVLFPWDDRWEQGNKGQDLRVRLEVGVLLEERDTFLGESWRIAAVLLLKKLVGICFQNAFKKISESYFQNS